MNVVIGAPSLITQLPEGPTLLVEAEGERLAAFSAALEHRQHPLHWHQAVLAAEADTLLTWHRFSDRRFDGPLGLEGWQPHYPNVQLLAIQSLAGTRLETLLEDWPQAKDSSGTFQLLVRQGDPLAALQGAGPWLRHLERVELLGPRAAQIWGETMDAWLVARGFCREEGRQEAWRRDPLATRLLALDALQKERDQLAEQLAQIRLEVDLMASQLDDHP
ncbi:hypothetical protein [Synechococcus sp. BA-132 BA5]|uniref:hypothetical protein n=1 Tax=Synechococcus sp. BA-132 BA5 TaxID=3110252 RepID=UPI002B20F446|nr:hypothetical protein [Synechococcus sp. BA-132 BA5]MEA5415555.1 hypothetical protein [Synechococcus sp. BA-132 BA5]